MQSTQGTSSTRFGAPARYQTQAAKRHWEWVVNSKCFTVLIILLILVTAALSISKLAMGIIYMNDCPIEIRVPIYLVVSGCAMVVFVGFYKLRPSDKEKQTFEDRLTHYGTIIGFVALLFFFIWLICGSVWVFGNYSDVIDGCNGSTNCCEKDLMRYAYVITVIDWIFIIICAVTILVTAGLLYCSRTQK